MPNDKVLPDEMFFAADLFRCFFSKATLSAAARADARQRLPPLMIATFSI
jgi:hypothetical protein